MDEDSRRAALVGCCALVFLVAAALMPAAGLGTFPSADPSGGGAGNGTATPAASGAPTATERPTTETPEPTTVETTAPETETETPERRNDPAPDPETPPPTEPAFEDTDDDGGTGIFAVVASVGGLLGLVSMVLAAGSVGVAGYAGTIGILSSLLGSDAVAGLPFAASIQAIPQATMGSLLSVSSSATAVADRLGSVGRVLGGSVSVDGRRLAAALVAPVAALGSLGRGFGSLAAALGDLSLWPSRGGTAATTPETDPRADETTAPAAEDGSSGPPRTVRAAFAWLQSAAPVRNGDAATAGEIAQSAIDAGYPSGPVERLTALFRRVRYGGYEQTDDRNERARSALQRVRSALGGDDD